MLIPFDIQISLLWFSELLICIAMLFCALMPKWRSACALMFVMFASYLILWDFFADISGDPSKYKAYLGVNALFILANVMVKPSRLAGKNIQVLLVAGALHAWEWYDMANNPNMSFIDSNYALLVAATYLVYIVSLKGDMSHAWGHYKLHRFDRTLYRRMDASNKRHVSRDNRVRPGKRNTERLS